MHQLFNGAVIQIGWESFGVKGAVLQGIDVIGAEWYWAPGRNATAGDNGNNAVISLQGPQYDLSMVQHHNNITVSDVRVDANSVGRLVAVGLHGAAPIGCSSVTGLFLSNFSVAHPLQWFKTNLSNHADPGENLLCAQGCDSVNEVVVDNLTIAGSVVGTSDAWNLDLIGNITGVSYT